MRGKQAAASARRRESTAAERAEMAERRMKAEREAHRGEINRLETEVGRLKADLLGEAAALAAVEVKRRLDEAEAERRKRGMSDDIALALMWQKDRLIRNACRYLSMTKGIGPLAVLPWVVTWATERDFDAIPDVHHLAVILGVPLDGWVARQWEWWSQTPAVKARRKSKLKSDKAAISLDRAFDEGHRDIHPDYMDWWYQEVDYGELTTDDGVEDIAEKISQGVTRRNDVLSA